MLWAYQAWRHHPQGSTLAALSAALRSRIAAFRPAELATCLQAFSALGFHPGNDVVQVPCLTNPTRSCGLFNVRIFPRKHEVA